MYIIALKLQLLYYHCILRVIAKAETVLHAYDKAARSTYECIRTTFERINSAIDRAPTGQVTFISFVLFLTRW